MQHAVMPKTCTVQEAVETLLQRCEALCGEPQQEIYDKEFFGFTYSSHGNLLSRSFSWLPRSPSAVHPMPSSPHKSASVDQGTAGKDKSKVFSGLAGMMNGAPPTRSSWLTSRSNSVQPLPYTALQADTAWPSVDAHASGLPASSISQAHKVHTPLRSKSSLTAASLFSAGRPLSSSDEDDALAIPEDLIDSAMFLLRDGTLAEAQAEVCCVLAERVQLHTSNCAQLQVHQIAQKESYLSSMVYKLLVQSCTACSSDHLLGCSIHSKLASC